MAGSSSLSYCAQQVRRHDRDRYLTCLFAPAERREDLFALYAFNLEVARTTEVVSEAMLGRIRLQWWRDALGEIHAGTPRRHEVIEPLARAVKARGLTRGHFERLIDAREADLEKQAPDTLARLEDYAEATSAGLILLTLEVLGASDEASGRAGRHVGIAWALAGLLRAVPFHARFGRLYLPRELSEAAGLDLGALFALRASPALAEVVRHVAARAGEHLAVARALRPQTAKAALPGLLPATLAGHYLDLLAGVEFDPFHPVVQGPMPGNVWRLVRSRLLGRY